MASLPGFRFDITGASGSQGLLSPKSSWRAYILPRGGYASQASTGTTITFDDAVVASRFAANNWIQVGLDTSTIQQVAAVGGNSITVGSAVTVSENDRVFLIGNTEPTVSGGSATYTTPDTLIYERDDDGSGLVSNSMITSNSDGLVQGFAATNFYDALIQDGNQANQGSIIDLPVGVVEGVSVSTDALFGASLTVNGALGVTGWATFGASVTLSDALGVTGHATFGSTLTGHANFGFTGHGIVGGSLTVASEASFGATATVDGALGVTGAVTLASTLDVTGDMTATGGFRSQVGPWMLMDVPSSSTSAIMYFGTTAAAASLWVPSRAGSIVGIAGTFINDVTGGTATLEIAVNSTINANSATIGTASTSAQRNSTTISKDTVTFAANDIVEMRVTTTADFLPDGSDDLIAFIEIEQ